MLTEIVSKVFNVFRSFNIAEDTVYSLEATQHTDINQPFLSDSTVCFGCPCVLTTAESRANIWTVKLFKDLYYTLKVIPLLTTL